VSGQDTLGTYIPLLQHCTTFTTPPDITPTINRSGEGRRTIEAHSRAITRVSDLSQQFTGQPIESMALPLTRVSGLTQPCSLPSALPRTGLLCSRSSSGLIAAGQRTSLGAALRMHMTPRGLQGEELETMDG